MGSNLAQQEKRDSSGFDGKGLVLVNTSLFLRKRQLGSHLSLPLEGRQVEVVSISYCHQPDPSIARGCALNTHNGDWGGGTAYVIYEDMGNGCFLLRDTEVKKTVLNPKKNLM